MTNQILYRHEDIMIILLRSVYQFQFEFVFVPLCYFLLLVSFFYFHSSRIEIAMYVWLLTRKGRLCSLNFVTYEIKYTFYQIARREYWMLQCLERQNAKISAHESDRKPFIEEESEERVIIFYLIAVKPLRAPKIRSINARRSGINEGPGRIWLHQLSLPDLAFTLD